MACADTETDDFSSPPSTVATLPAMTFVTKLTLQSGDRAALDSVVGDIAAFVEGKGAEMKGPHSNPPETRRVPQHKHTAGGEGTFAPWEYTVYTRTIEIVGHDDVARRVTERSFPPGIHAEVELEQIRQMGSA